MICIHRSSILIFFATLLLASCSLFGSSSALAGSVLSSRCPFCAAINATFAEQIDKHELVVIAEMVEAPPEIEEDAYEYPKGKFRITQVIKGEKFVAADMIFQTQLVGNYPVGQQFLVMGVEPPDVFWSTPMKTNDRIVKYLLDSQKLPASGPDRLAFFQDYFEDEDSVLAFDAYDEYAIADYNDLIAMKDRIKRDQIIKWINDPELRVDRRRLYFTMLGVCGQPEDIEMLEGFINSGDSEKLAGLDSLVACYLTLKGADGLPLIEEKFLKNPDLDFVDANAVVSALRFHGTEVKVIPREKITASVRLLLDRPNMADMIIPDLARWEDWSVMDRLVKMFKETDEDSQWIRVPVITYLRACPKPEAKAHIKELAKIDPDAVRRADFFMGGFVDDEEDDEDEEAGKTVKEGKGGGPDGQPREETNGDSDEFSINDVNGDQEALDADSTTNSESIVQVLKVPFQDSLDPPYSQPNPDQNFLAGPSMDAFAGNITLGPNSSFSSEFSEKTETSSLPVNPRTTKSVSQEETGTAIAAVTDVSAAEVPLAAGYPPTSTTMIILIPLAISLMLFLLLWSVVNGWFERLIY